MRWRNDGGWTTEIARSPDDGTSSPFDWRISVAEIEADGAFSTFPGIDRQLALVSGAGMELVIGEAPPLCLDQRLAAVPFSGDEAVSCRLLDGPTRDFNVMARRGVVRTRLWCRPLVDRMVLFPKANVAWFVHVLAGAATVEAAGDTWTLDAGDSLDVDSQTAGAGRVLVAGGGELALVEIERLAGRCG